MPGPVYTESYYAQRQGSDTQPLKKLKTQHPNTEHATPQAPLAERMWTVRNRPDYNPVIYRPHSVKFIDDSLVVSEGLWPHSRLQVFDFHGHSKKVIGQGQILPFGMTRSALSNHMAVTDHKDRTVKIFSCQGDMVASWRPNLLSWPNGICMNKAGHFLICDWMKGTVAIHDGYGSEIKSFKTSQQDKSHPNYIAVDDHDRIIVSDTYDHFIKVFDNSGKLLSQFGGGGEAAAVVDKLHDPRGITVDSNGNILVADPGLGTIRCFSSEGNMIKDIAGPSEGLQYPWAVEYDPQRKFLAVTEQKVNCEPALQLFKWEGVVL